MVRTRQRPRDHVRDAGAVQAPDDVGQKAGKGHELARPGEPSRRSQIVAQDDLRERDLDFRGRDVGPSATDPRHGEGSHLGTHDVGNAEPLSWGQRSNRLGLSFLRFLRSVERPAHGTTVRQ